MGAVGKYDRLVQKYLKRTKRFKTLEEFDKSIERRQKKDERKPVKLSFAIQKAPERKTTEKAPIDKKPRQKIKKEIEEKKTVVIPEKFIKIAKKFGLPEENLQFFYENRKSFHLESMQKKNIHCVELTCKFTTKASPKCLVEHMISAHNYQDIPCDKTDCSYSAFSHSNMKHHQSKFHGHGMKNTDFGDLPCPVSSCKASFRFPSHLNLHVDVHENRVQSCSYCQYHNVTHFKVHDHLLIHFNVKNFACDVCPGKFTRKGELTQHILKVHTTDDFICRDCGFVAKKHGRLQRHRSTCKERLKFSRIL